MDPAILLDNFSPVDMDMWHTCNSFLNDDNLSNGLKMDHHTDSANHSIHSSPTEIKDENIGSSSSQP